MKKTLIIAIVLILVIIIALFVAQKNTKKNIMENYGATKIGVTSTSGSVLNNDRQNKVQEIKSGFNPNN